METSIDDLNIKGTEVTGYCTCERPVLYSDTESNTFGYFYRCSKCGKRIDDELHYYNHYDGEDHDDVDLYDYS